jgi:hypothetical protein
MSPDEIKWWSTNMPQVKSGNCYDIIKLFYQGWLIFNWSNQRRDTLLYEWWKKFGREKNIHLLKTI